MHVYTVNWFLTRMLRRFNAERIIFLINGTGTVEYLYKKSERESWPYLMTYKSIGNASQAYKSSNYIPFSRKQKKICYIGIHLQLLNTNVEGN